MTGFRTTAEMEAAIERYIRVGETLVNTQDGTWLRQPGGMWVLQPKSSQEEEAPTEKPQEPARAASTPNPEPKPTQPTAEAASPAQEPPMSKFRTTALKISVSANNKVNCGNYESADRSVFYTKDIAIEGEATEAEIAEIIQESTRGLQAMAEAENARIIALFLSENSANEGLKGAVGLFNKVFQKFSLMAQAAFGLAPEVACEALPVRGLAGVTYLVGEAKTPYVFAAKRWLKLDAPAA